MQIQPTEAVTVLMSAGQVRIVAKLLELNDDELRVISPQFLDRDALVLFKAKHFRGEAQVVHVSYQQSLFTYTLKITSIKFQPGLLVNTQL